jgi:hypothetical protein
LKATCTTTGINVDISVNRHNGYQAADLIKKILSRHKILRPVIILLKILLKKFSLNEAHSGGMSSFLLFHLVYFFFVKNKNNEINYSSISNWVQKNNKDSEGNITIYKSKKFFLEDESDSEKSEDSKSNKGFTLTKAASNSDDDYNSNEEDSNLVQNGVSSSDSDFEQKNDSKEYMLENKTKLSTILNSSDEDNNNKSDKNDSDNEDDEEEVKILSNTKLVPDNKNLDIHDFLLNFLYYYGFQFNHSEVGLKVTEDETYETFFKAERFDMDCSDTICVESIQDQGNDIGKSCYRYENIRKIFTNTYNTIKSEMNNNTVSILQALNFPTV